MYGVWAVTVPPFPPAGEEVAVEEEVPAGAELVEVGAAAEHRQAETPHLLTPGASSVAAAGLRRAASSRTVPPPLDCQPHGLSE